MSESSFEKIPCTVGILTHNSEQTLENALKSAASFSDVIVCDGNSRDRTVQIAETYGARVISQDSKYLDESARITDFAGVRNQMLGSARERWFFFLDADEYASPELVTAIAQATKSESAAYWVHRLYELDGVRIDCASTYPNKNMRFFHRDAVTQFIKPIHERIEVKEGAVVRELPASAPLMVPVLESPAESREKNRRYIQAEIARRPHLTVAEWTRHTVRHAAISVKYLLRMLRNRVTCRGTHFPLRYEINRHWYHLALAVAELSHIIKTERGN